MASNAIASQTDRKKVTMHDGFLKHAGYRWLKIATFIILVCIVSYIFIDVSPRHNGGSWYGYTLGTIGALLDFASVINPGCQGCSPLFGFTTLSGTPDGKMTRHISSDIHCFTRLNVAFAFAIERFSFMNF